MSESSERRNFLKYAATAIVCGVVAGAGGYFGGAASVPASVETTVTKTVAGPGETVTKTVGAGETATKTVTTTVTGTPTPTVTEMAVPSNIGLAYDFASCETPFFTVAKRHNEGRGIVDLKDVDTEFSIFPCESAAELREAVHTGMAPFAFSAYEFFPVVDAMGNFVYTNGLHTGCILSCVSNGLWDQNVRDEAGFIKWVEDGIAEGEKRKVNVSHYGNSPFWWLAVMLREHDLDVRNDIEVTVTDAAVVPVAINTGKIDCAFEWDPIPRIIEKEGFGHIIVDQGVDEPWCQCYCCSLGVQKTFLDDHTNFVKNFLKSLMEAGLFLKYHPHEAAKDIISFGPELCPYTEEELVEMYATYKYDIAGDDQMQINTFKKFWAPMYEQGLLVHDVDWAMEHGYRHIDVSPEGTMTDGRT